MAGPIIISADEIKEALPGYTPTRSGEFHRESARRADKQFEKAVNESEKRKVILLSGGSASGKTEYCSAYLMEESAVIYDGTLPSYEGFSIKRKKAHRAGKTVEVHAVIPQDLKRAFSAFLHRERVYDDTHFYQTHARSRRTLLSIAENDDGVAIFINESNFRDDDSVFFTRIKADRRSDFVEYLRQIQYTEEDIVKSIYYDS